MTLEYNINFELYDFMNICRFNVDIKHDNCYRSSQQYCLHYRGLTDELPNLRACTVIPVLVSTK